MAHSVDIRVSDDACAATLVQGCAMLNIAMNDDAALIITNDKTQITEDKQIVFLGASVPENVAAHFALPVSLSLLMQRVQQLTQQSDKKAEAGDIVLDMAKRHITKGAATETLTDKETQLLMMLMEGEGNIIAKEALLHEIWGYHPDLDTHTLETHIYRLRGKFSDIGSTLSIDAKDGGYILVMA